MRALVQRSTDGLYMKSKLEWVRQKDEARTFSSSVDALAYCIAAGLSEIRLVVTSAAGADCFLYPFGEERTPQTATLPVRRFGAARLMRKPNRPAKVVQAGLASRAQARPKRVSRA